MVMGVQYILLCTKYWIHKIPGWLALVVLVFHRHFALSPKIGTAADAGRSRKTPAFPPFCHLHYHPYALKTHANGTACG